MGADPAEPGRGEGPLPWNEAIVRQWARYVPHAQHPNANTCDPRPASSFRSTLNSDADTFVRQRRMVSIDFVPFPLPPGGIRPKFAELGAGPPQARAGNEVHSYA